MWKVRQTWVLRSVSVVLLWLLVSTATLIPAADAAVCGDDVTLEQVLCELAVDEVTADYIVLLDTSASMRENDLYTTAVEQLRALLRELPPSDHLSLITFDSQAHLEYTADIGTPPDQALNDIAPPDGEKTDIGKAIAAALDELERPDAAPLGVVLLLTDGVQDPVAGSPYPADIMGPAWDALAARAATLPQRVSALGLSLTPGADAGLLERAFSDTVIVSLPIDRLGGYFGRIKEQARIDKARDLLGSDASSRVEVTWGNLPVEPQGSATVDVTVRSTARHVPLTVERLSAVVKGPPLEVQGVPEEGFALEPGESRSFSLRLTWRTLAGAPIIKRGATATDSLLGITGDVGSPWASILTDDLGFEFVPQLVAAELQIPGIVRDGWLPAPVAVAVPVVLALLTAAWFAWTYRCPRLSGQLKAMAKTAGLDGKRLVRIGEKTEIDIPGKGWVRGIRSSRRRQPGLPDEYGLRIVYKAPGPGRSGMLTGRSRCDPGSSVIVNGTIFTHEPTSARYTDPSPHAVEEPVRGGSKVRWRQDQ